MRSDRTDILTTLSRRHALQPGTTRACRSIAAAMVALAVLGAAPASNAGAAADEKVIHELLQIASDKNPALRAQRQRIKAVDLVPSQTRALPDPFVDIELMNLNVTRPSLTGALTEGISVGVQQALPYPGKRDAAEKEARGKADAERARLFAIESMVRGQVAAAAYKIAMLKELIELNEQTRLALEAAAQTAAAVYAAGKGTQADVLLAQTAITRMIAKRETLEQQRAIARARMESLLGGPADERLLDRMTIPEPGALPPLDELFNDLAEASPEVLMGRADERAMESGIEVARLDAKPEFMVGGRYKFHDPSMNGEDFITLMFGMTLPFFQRDNRYGPAIQEASLKREGARLDTEGILNASRFALSEAYRSAAKNLRVHGLVKDGLLLQARQAYESMLGAYGVGKADFGSLLMALTEMYDAHGDIIMAKADYQEAVAMMTAALGRDTLRADPSAGKGRR